MEIKNNFYDSPLRYEDWARYEEETSSRGTFLKCSERISRYFLWAYKQRLNIRAERRLVVLGWKALREAAAAYVNNNNNNTKQQHVADAGEARGRTKRIGGWVLEVTPEFRAACRHFPRITAARSATGPSASPATPGPEGPFGPRSWRRSCSSSRAAGGAAELSRDEGSFGKGPAGGGRGRGEGSGCRRGQRDRCPRPGVWSWGWVRSRYTWARV